MPAPARLLLVHKQRTSARIRFLRYADGMVAPDAFPKLSQVLGEDEDFRKSEVVAHPAMVSAVWRDLARDQSWRR